VPPRLPPAIAADIETATRAPNRGRRPRRKPHKTVPLIVNDPPLIAFKTTLQSFCQSMCRSKPQHEAWLSNRNSLGECVGKKSQTPRVH
jgi:hypothetical protein